MHTALRTSGSSSTSMSRVAASSRRRLGMVCGARAGAAPSSSSSSSSRGGGSSMSTSSSGSNGRNKVLSASGESIDALVAHTNALSVTSATRGLSTLCRASATLDVEATEAGSGDADANGDGQKFATAYLKGLRMGPNKVRRVAYAIRGRSYEEALMILEFMPYHACEPLLKLLYSAASNAKNMYGLNKSKLYVSELRVDMGKNFKRARIGGRGRIKPYKKFGCHVFIKVEER